MAVPVGASFIKNVKLPDNSVYWFKDEGARDLIAEMQAGGLSFVIAWDGTSAPVAANIPAGVVIHYNNQTYTGTLTAGTSTKPNIYLVHCDDDAPSGSDYYDEYVTVNFGTTADPTWGWERLGSTQINLDLGELAYKDTVTLNKSTDSVLKNVSWAHNHTVTITPTTDSFVKSYPGVTNKLETTTITGTGNNVTFNAVSADPGTVTATNTVFGTDSTASYIVTESKTTTNTVFTSDATASLASAGTAVAVATTGTTVSGIIKTTDRPGGVLFTATVGSGDNSETLILTGASTGSGVNLVDITPAVSNGTITPYTFTDVTVPQVSSNETVNVASVKTNTNVTVPQITSNSAVTAAAQITLKSVTAATKATAATTVATGSLNSSDTVGATIMTGLGNATTASAWTGTSAISAAAASFDTSQPTGLQPGLSYTKISALTDSTDVTVS